MKYTQIFRSRVRNVGRSRYPLMKSRMLFASKLRRSRRPGTKFFFRRQRRLSRPEIKWIDIDFANTDIGKQTRASYVITPTTIDVGAQTNQRIGKEVKFRKVVMKSEWSTNPSATGTVTRADQVFRIVFWTPRVAFDTAQAYMDQMDYEETPDWNIVTVHRDRYVGIGFDQWVWTKGSTDYSTPPVYPAIKHLNFNFKFPRSVKIGSDGNNLVDPNKDRMYMTVFNPNQCEIRWNAQVKTTYIDP